MAVNVPGAISVFLFYSVILVTGLWASCKEKRRAKNTTESVVLAGRNIGLGLGTLTMIATWCGGGIVNGASERVFTKGLLSCQSSIAFGMSLLAGGLIFAKPMRQRGYVTMMDPLQQKYGSRIGSILLLPSIAGDIIWLGAVLSALGATLSVILGIDNVITIVSSAGVMLIYTLLGGMYSVAYTDVIQLFCIIIGMTICVPFAWHHPAVNQETLFAPDWIGTIEPLHYASYVDNFLLLTFGGITTQAYFQRILSMKTVRDAQLTSYIATFLCPLMAIPAILMGGIARSTDWAGGTYYRLNITTSDQTKEILPLALQYLTPSWVSFYGLGAISAAIMSSVDSIVLGVSSMFALNVFKAMIFPKVSDRVLTIAIRVTMIVVTAMSTGIALTLTSIYSAGVLCADLLYALLFPQLVLVLYFPDRCNKYGCLASFFIGALLRCLCGDSLLGVPAIIQLPLFSDGEQYFPFRTAIMLVSCFSHLLISHLSWRCFANGWLDPKYDWLECFTAEQHTARIEWLEDPALVPIRQRSFSSSSLF